MARLIKDWTASEKVDLLSVDAERFFTRLIMKSDDFGNYTGNIKLINAALFPLKELKADKVEGWLSECCKAGLVVRYKVDGKDFIHIPGFDQKLRRMKAVYPQPTDNQVSDICRTSVGQVSDKCPPEVEEEVEVEEETEVELELERACVWPTFDDFWDSYDKKIDRPKAEKKWEGVTQAAREKIMDHVPRYVMSTPDPKYRKDPTTYLNNQSWNNEIITKSNDRNNYLASLAIAAAK